MLHYVVIVLANSPREIALVHGGSTPDIELSSGHVSGIYHSQPRCVILCNIYLVVGTVTSVLTAVV
jgi:hypothetical protein